MDDTDQYWVQAAPFRALVTRLLDLSGLPLPLLADHAGVPPAAIQSLLAGRDGRPSGRISRECAQQLLAIDETRLLHLARLRYQ